MLYPAELRGRVRPDRTSAKPVPYSVGVTRAILLCLLLAGCRKLWTPEEAFPRVAARLQKLRGITFKLPEFTVLTRAQWIGRLGELEREPDYDALWNALGSVPEGVDPAADYRAVERRARGYYDLAKHEVVYITDTPRDLREQALAHSLVHALQRDKSTLWEPLPKGGYADDLNWARLVAREAEAICYELAWPHGSLGRIDVRRIRFDTKGCAPYAVRWAYFGYVVGAKYLLARARGSLRDACDALWKKPPLSTEQVLHPERDDPPVAVFAPDLSVELGKDWQLVVTTVLGEWTIADWIGFGQPKIDGGLPDDLRWGGDVAQVYRKGDRRTIAVWTVWDDEASARNFEKRLRGVKLRSGKRVAVVFGGSTELLRAGLSKLRTVPFRTIEELEAAIESD